MKVIHLGGINSTLKPWKRNYEDIVQYFIFSLLRKEIQS